MSAELKGSHPDVDWKNIAAFRNAAVYDYLGIDLKQIWEIVEKDLPTLKKHIEEMVA